MSVAVWTIVSRCTGVLRGIVVAAVLGATYFANTYQFTNSLPNLVFYGLLAGSLFSSILVPALVPHVDSGDTRGRRANRRRPARRGDDSACWPSSPSPRSHPLPAEAGLDRRHERRVPPMARSTSGRSWSSLLLPQVALYAVVCTAPAVMNAHRRFALASAAPALENLGTIVVLGAVAIFYHRTTRAHQVPSSLVLLLGAGTTAAVLLHASVQWWGARRVGVVLLPRAGWRNPQVREIIGGHAPGRGSGRVWRRCNSRRCWWSPTGWPAAWSPFSWR